MNRVKSKQLAVVIFSAILISIIGGSGLEAKTAKEIDASVDVTIERFYKQVEGSKQLAGKSKAMLVMPNVIKGAFIVGGEYGEGALRISGKTIDYYNLVSGSFGFQIGGEAKDIILLFMKEGALKKFRNSSGWEAGIDGNVALITVGAGERVDTKTAQEDIIGFVFDAKGLIADISLKGAKFTKLDKK